MPTSLVSTGVQFPDSTIQTTAAVGGGAWTLLTSGTFPGNTSDIDVTTGFSTTYDTYWLLVQNVVCTNFNIRLDYGSGFLSSGYGTNLVGNSSVYSGANTQPSNGYGYSRIPIFSSDRQQAVNIYLYNRNGSNNHFIVYQAIQNEIGTGGQNMGYCWGMGGQSNNSGSITGIRITGDGIFTQGFYFLYGLKKT